MSFDICQKGRCINLSLQNPYFEFLLLNLKTKNKISAMYQTERGTFKTPVLLIV